MTQEEELAGLRSKLAKRRNRPGYADNTKAIEARIAELETPDGDI
jgi:hypothetical protein